MESKTIIISGSRDWTDAAIINLVMAALVSEFGTDIHIVHGAARGADKHAAWYAYKHGVPTENIHGYPADWNKYKLAAGPIRNREMLDKHPDADLLVAFPLLTSKGTCDMIDEARRRGLEIRIYDTKGNIVDSKNL
jgi:hypothetical protein